MKSNRSSGKIAVRLAIGTLLLLCAGCTTQPDSQPAFVPPPGSANSQTNSLAALPFLPPTRVPGSPVYTPTPDPLRTLPPLRTQTENYVVQPGDTLGRIARRFGIDLNTLVAANQITNPNLLEVGQILVIPPPQPGQPAPEFKIIPDSELVYGPVSVTLDIPAFVNTAGGYLSHYTEDINGVVLTGAQIVADISRDHSVNPRLLLAALEYQSRWVTQAQPPEETLEYPLGLINPARRQLYRQLYWAANELNRGYYLWRVNAISSFALTDGSIVPANATVNAGTAGVQYLMSQVKDQSTWRIAVSSEGVFAAYQRLFGYPFDLAIEPIVPPTLTQPPMQLPFEPGTVWSFTGGPHGGWADGSGWAGIDFAPPGEALGCVPSDAWVTAVADGLITRSDSGVVIQDLDGDGYEQTGWTVLYLHIESRDRVQEGAYLRAGERIGHPSCEGGISSGTHVHLARRYNGEWIPADGPLPFNLDGWISSGFGIEYDGILTRNGQVVEAWEGRRTENQIQR